MCQEWGGDDGQVVSYCVWHGRGMKKRVTLEPELDAGALSPFDRLWLAKKLRRWIRQLEVSARALSAPQRRPGRRLPRQVARWN